MEIKPTEKEPIYAPENKYGYKINVNHPVIRILYDRYKKWKGIKMIPSDKERFEFEHYIEQLIQKKTETKVKKKGGISLVQTKIYRLRKTESLRNK